MNHPQNLVELYRKFYRAPNIYKRTSYGPSARKSIQPVFDAFDILCRADSSQRNVDTLIQLIAGSISKLINRIRSNTALGYWVIQDYAQEHQAILDFSQYVVKDIFYGSFNGDVGRFAGRQRGYLEDACEFLYRLEEDKEKTDAKR